MLHTRVETIFLTLPQIPVKMKRKLVYIACLFLIACSFKSCSMLGDNCQVCRLVSYENGHVTDPGVEGEYCGDDLLTIKATPPVTTGGVTTQWECY
jgi:hypothetical protein